jgi:MFS family permease
MIGSGAGVALLLWLPNLWVLYAFAVVYGLFRGAYVLMMTLVWADYYGRRFLGSIRGIATPLSLVSSAGGPVLAGFLFDARGDYTLALQVFTACYILAGLLALMAPPPVHSTRIEGSPGAL